MGDKGHFWISIIKSIIRIVGFIFLMINLPVGAIILIVAEAFGIAEELVDKRGVPN